MAETQYTYDGAGRLTRERRADWNLNVDYTLDAAGNRTVLKWPDAFQVTYAYDGANRVTSITGGSTLYRSYAYDVLSRRGSQIAAPGAGGTVGPNSITTTYGYEIDSDLASLVHNYPGSTTDPVYNHTYSASGRLLTTTTSEVLNRYVEPGTPGTQSYAAANPLNQYPSVTPIGGSAVTLSFDLNGNLTGDGGSTYTFDATNRLASITGLITASYGYDALDRRSSKTSSGITTRFLHAGSDEIAEYSSAGALLRRYVPGPGADERAVLIDSGLLSPPATAPRYPHTDRLGSVVAVTDSTGAVSERFTYDGFGRSTSPMSGYPFRFTGQRLDSETGLMFYKARVYSQALGRFLQTDPIGTKDDLNLYAYVGNDPINSSDPSGMESEEQAEFRRLQHASSDRMMAESWALIKEYHPAGAPFKTYDEVRSGDYSGALWAAGTAGAGKALQYGGAALSFTGRALGSYADDALNWGRRALGVACCFAKGTLVATKDGLTAIEQVRVGDLVLSRDEKTGETAYKPVTALVPKHKRVIWVVTLSVPSVNTTGSPKEFTFQTTDDHPWRLSTGIWLKTAQLRRGMYVVRADGAAANIVSVFNTVTQTDVYNLEVADFHTYFVGRELAWVHNACDELHHAIPKFLGGDAAQLKSLLTQGQHVDFHAELRAALRAKGFPYDASNTSAATWAKYFQDNPGSQERAYKAVLETSQAFDAKYGTNLESAFLYNLLRGRFTPYP